AERAHENGHRVADRAPGTGPYPIGELSARTPQDPAQATILVWGGRAGPLASLVRDLRVLAGPAGLPAGRAELPPPGPWQQPVRGPGQLPGHPGRSPLSPCAGQQRALGAFGD